MTAPLYLDNFSTTACDPEVVKAMLPYFSTNFANAGSSHRMGKNAQLAVDNGRAEIAKAIGANATEIIFTSGATESNNLAIFGLAAQATKRKHIVTSEIEHKSVLEPLRHLKGNGFEVSFLPVTKSGRVSSEELKSVMRPDTFLVTIQAANNEIGTIQNISELATIAHQFGSLFHTDAAQLVGKASLDVLELGIDLLSFSAHKVYGPKGIGALYLCGGVSSLPISPVCFGGGQEKGLRSGTLNVPSIVGFATALSVSKVIQKKGSGLAQTRDLFETLLLKEVAWAKVNGDKTSRLSGGTSITFPGIEADALMANLPELVISSGAACSSGAQEPSHVLGAIGLSQADAFSTVRICFAESNGLEDAKFAAERIGSAANRLKEL